MEDMKPRPGIYREDFIAANQNDRADNVIVGTTAQQLSVIRGDIKNFKASHNLDKVIILWTANTERFCDVTPGVHDTAENLLQAIKAGHSEVSQSTVFAVAACLEG